MGKQKKNPQFEATCFAITFRWVFDQINLWVLMYRNTHLCIGTLDHACTLRASLLILVLYVVRHSNLFTIDSNLVSFV
jgi:hypothetical protein